MDAQRKILVVGAAKDLTVLGNVEFTNTNKAEDNALVVGAADNVMIDGANLSMMEPTLLSELETKLQRVFG